jgi:hypothetical protein
VALGAEIAEMVNDSVKRVSLGKRAMARARSMNWERCASATYYLPLPQAHYSSQSIELPPNPVLHAQEAAPIAGRRFLQ